MQMEGDNKRKALVYDIIKIKTVIFSELKKHDIFRLIEPDGVTVTNEQNKLFKATSDAYLNNGIYTIDCEPYNS